MHELKRFDMPNDDWWCSTCRRKLATVTGTSLLGYRACDLDHYADCGPVTPEMPTEHAAGDSGDAAGEQPTKPDRPTEQPTTATEVQVAMEPNVYTHKLQIGHLRPRCRACGGKARLGCRICNLDFCMSQVHATC